jgi:hypothetical protein
MVVAFFVPKRKEVHLVWSVGAKANSVEQIGPNLHNTLNLAHQRTMDDEQKWKQKRK